jgi:hypothetical protein
MNEQQLKPEIQITPDMEKQMEEIKEILNTPVINTTMALNIIINAVQVCYENADVFNDLDRALIAKALESFKEQVKKNEDFLIKIQQPV